MRISYLILMVMVLLLGGRLVSIVSQLLPKSSESSQPYAVLTSLWQRQAKAQNVETHSAVTLNEAAEANQNSQGGQDGQTGQVGMTGIANFNSSNGMNSMMLIENNNKPLGGEAVIKKQGQPVLPAPATNAFVAQSGKATDGDANSNPLLMLGAKNEKNFVAELAQRRQELDSRDQSLQQREAMLAAAEKQIQDRQKNLEKLRDEVQAMLDDFKKNRQQAQLSVMETYKVMKPKAAAEIFNGLPIANLISVVQALSPRVLAPIMAEMNPAKAVELTTALATDSLAQLEMQKGKTK